MAGLITDGLGNLYGTTESGGDGDAGTVYAVRADGSGFRILHSFAWDGTDGGNPLGPLVLDSFGSLFGTTARGGEGAGTVFTLRTDGTGYRVLRPFSGPTTLNVLPTLLLDGSGHLFGMTSDDGGAGTLFRMKTDGAGFTILHAFSYIFGPGPPPGLNSSLATDGSGTVYGVAPTGGLGGGGTIWAIGIDGLNYRVLHNFGVTAANGLTPDSNLVVDASGGLLGTTRAGGSSGAGVVFRLAVDGSGFSVLAGFPAGSGPGAAGWISLTLDAGVLFGASVPGPALATGPTLFRIGADGTGLAVLRTIGGATTQNDQIAGPPLLLGATLIGVSSLDGAHSAGTIFSIGRDGSSFRTLFDFVGLAADGLTPRAPLVLDAAGNLYGTTDGLQSVFTMKTDGSGFRILHFFGRDSFGGYLPMVSLTLDTSGNLFGTTRDGGPSEKGTIFALRTDGTQFRLLHAFSEDDGDSPNASLLLGSDGNLYGTTQFGGSAFGGTIFTLKTDGSTFRVIRSLSVRDGWNPLAGLVQDVSGRLYGTTSVSGLGNGTVFSIQPDGSDYRVLHEFLRESSDGQLPSAPLLLDGTGNLYGTTLSGPSAANWGFGTLFTLRLDGTGYQILHVFDGYDGASPMAPLIQDPWGNLYGTTSRTWLPAYTGGEVFTLRPDGSAFRVLHDFGSVWPDGAGPTAGLVRDPVGNLYGTTSSGGTAGGGAEFVLKDVCSASPDITVASGSNPTCLGSSLTLDAGDGFATYLWSTGATTRTITVSPSTATTYTVAGTVAGCPGPIPAGSLTVGVSSSIPPAPVPTNDGPRCEGQTVQLMVDLVPGASYAWTGPNGFASSQPLPALGYASAAASGNYSVTLTVGGCTSAPGTTAVVVHPRPSKPVITSPAAVPAWATFVASVPPLPGITYSWYVLSDGTLVSGQGTETVTVQANGVGTLILLVMATDVATGCTSYSSGEVSIQVLPGPMFNTLTPCRVLDSRLTTGAAAASPSLFAGESRTFTVAGLCGIPAGASSLSANLTVTNARSDGGLELNAAGVGPTGLAVVDFAEGRTRANNAIVSLAADGSIVVTNDSTGTVDFVLDVNGYFE